MTSILQDWVMELGLRHQGVLVSAIRGCDGVPKDDDSKGLIRALRCEILNAHCGDPVKAASFIEKVSQNELARRMTAVTANFDHYPVHFIQHLMAAAEIIGYYDGYCQGNGLMWLSFYELLCKKLHVNPETKEQCDKRLDADEKTFAKAELHPEFNVEGTRSGRITAKFAERFPEKNDNGRIIGRPCCEQLPEALCQGYFDHKAMNVSVLSNHYSPGNDANMWEIGWHCANKAKHNGYDDPRPREEGYNAYYDNRPVTDNPYQGIAIGSGEWTTGWQHAENNDKLQQKIAAGLGHICDGNRGHNNQDCPDSEEHRMAGFNTSGFYDGHIPTVQELDAEAARNYRGVRS